MKDLLVLLLVAIISVGLLTSSFVLGAIDGCADAGYDTFVLDGHGIYCQSSFESANPVYFERQDL